MYIVGGSVNPIRHRLFLDHDIIFDSSTILNKIQRKSNLRKILNTSENILENGAFAPNEQMLNFPYFQIHDISKASKGAIMEYRVKGRNESCTPGRGVASI